MSAKDNLWDIKVKFKKHGDFCKEYIAVRIDHKYYIIDDENRFKSDKKMRGHYGKKFLIKFFEGNFENMIFETTNLFHEGNIPDEYKEFLPDNAVFVQCEKPTHTFSHGKILSIISL